MINKRPYIEMRPKRQVSWEGWKDIGREIKRKVETLDKKRIVVAIEFYQGTYASVNLNALKEVLSPNVTCRAGDVYLDENYIRAMARKDMIAKQSGSGWSAKVIEDYFDPGKLEGLRNNIAFIEEGVILIHGVGSSRIWDPDILIYSDVSKWEALQRFRRGDILNIGVNNEDDSFEQHFRWSYFVDWRICDKIKRSVIPVCHYFLETNNWERPKMANGDIMRAAYESMASQPFFTAPFFDPELWEQNNEGKGREEFSWVFDCNFEQNNVLIKINDHLIETPVVNAVYVNPQGILGEAVYRKFGLELPIRFTFIDTMDDPDNNVYVYPGLSFFKDNFSVYQRQYDNYYVMYAGKGAGIHIGLKEDVSKEYFKSAVLDAKSARSRKDLRKLLNTVPVKEHDYLFVPDRTLHSHGSNVMLLNTSTASSIFEMRLFDEERSSVAADEIQHFIDVAAEGSEYPAETLNSIRTSRTAPYVEEMLGDQANKDIVIRRIWADADLMLETNKEIMILNLIKGDEVTIAGDFDPLLVHYAESFVVPAAIPQFTVKVPKGQQIGLLLASVK